MLFENKGKWFNESEDIDKDMLNDEQQELAMEDDASDLLAEDDLDLADEDINDDSEDIFNDKEKDEACKQKNEATFNVGDKVRVIDREMMTYDKTGEIYSMKNGEYFVKFKDDVAGTTLIPHTADQLVKTK